MPDLDPSIDPLLYVIVDDANSTKNEDWSRRITVIVGGVVITGTVVSDRQWFEMSGRPEVARTLREIRERWDNARELLEDFPDDVHGLLVRQTPGRRYLHMKDARFVYGSTFVPTGEVGVLWRCRLDQVSGWSDAGLAMSAENPADPV